MSALQNVITEATHFAVQSLSDVIGSELSFVLHDVEIENFTASHFSAQKFGIVQLECSGLLNAEILLMFDIDGIFLILKKMLGAAADNEMILECENEAMCELGNVVMIRYLSEIADYLHTPLESTLPTYRVELKDEFLKDVDSKKCLIASHVDLNLDDYTAEMKILFSVSRESFENLKQTLH